MKMWVMAAGVVTLSPCSYWCFVRARPRVTELLEFGTTEAGPGAGPAARDNVGCWR